MIIRYRVQDVEELYGAIDLASFLQLALRGARFPTLTL